MRFGELLLQPLDGRVAEVIVVVMAYHHGIHNGQVFNLTRRRRVSL